jgi:DNA polymerase III epsilon subunit-like protein
VPYCSLDIETSDFDPANGEVIEIGMVFFEVREHGVEVLREYQSVFKPSKPVSPRILALTNIRQEELDSAPLFREKSEEIQEMVSGAVVLGHNIGFDTKFLEGFGIKFSGLKVDTLDLAQVLLPTLKSYNLEALMNYLGVGHKDAHRALADAKACVTVLEKLVGYCATFPKNLRENLAQLLQGNSVVDELALLLKKDFPHFAAPEQQLNAKVATAQSEEVSSSLKASQEIVSFPLGVDHHSYVYGALAKTREKVVLVVPDRTTTYKLWQSNIAEPVFANDDLFNEKLFEKNLKLATTPEQQIFFAKMLVWKNLNWQTRSLVDVNFAFAGGQFKSLVSYGSRKKPVEQDGDAAVLVTDYASFIANGAAFKDRKAVILDINSFESALTNLCSRKVSWSDFTYRLKQLQADESVFADVDLYFGLASMYFRKLEQEQAHLLIDEKIQESDEFAQFSKATLGFAKKIEKLNKVFASEVLERYVESLKEFLVPEKNTARWVEMYEGKMSLNASPIDLHDISAKKLGIFSSVIFTCSLGSDALVGYFADRLNLKDFKIKTIGQQAVRPKFTVSIQPEKADKLLELTLSLDAPAAVLVGSSGALRDFYEAQYLTLGEKFKVSAQTYSGGTNKLLDNFSMNGNGLFLGTNNFILKQANRKLKVKNLVITRLPFEQFNHPLFAIQAARYQNQFADFSIPRALYNFHAIINFFYSDELEKIYILDAKINKEYGKYFTEYLRSLPFVEIG